MPKITQLLTNVFDGVSRQPVLQRTASQAQVQTNWLSLYRQGLSRRPPARHLALLFEDTTDWQNAFMHEIRMADGARYLLIVHNDELKVFDATTGVEASVTVSGAANSYIATNTRGFRAITIGNRTFLVNCATTVRKGTTTSDAWTNEALLFVRAGDYETAYTVTLNGVEVTFTTPDTGRDAIATDAITVDLLAAMNAEPDFDEFSFTQIGSCIYVERIDGTDFTISAKDGLGDTALIAIKRTVQRFTDLPTKAVEGFTVEVTGDDSTKFDNYYVQYTEVDTPDGAGVWREVPEPGTVVSLAASTMPHLIEYAPALYTAEVEDFAEWYPDVFTNESGGPSFETTKTYTFSGVLTFPVGSKVTVATQMGTATYTNNTAAAVDANTVLNSLQPTLDAFLGLAASHPSANVLELVYGTGLITPPVITIEMDPTTTKFYDGNLSLVASALVGYTVKNITDGSEGTITANDATSVTCGAGLTGGASNEFQPGDVIEIYNAGVYFVFKPAAWEDRTAGDTDSSPFPSFVGGKIEDVLEAEGRLWFLSGPNAIASRPGEPLDFFRQTATQLLPDDPIDVRSALKGPAFHGGVNWNGAIYLFSEAGSIHKLAGEPVYTPTTVTLKQVGAYQSDPDVHPVVLGDYVYFATMLAGKPIVQELRRIVQGDKETLTARDITTHVRGYMEGTPLQLIADDTRKMLFLRVSPNRNQLFAYNFSDNEAEREQASWSQWDTQQVVGMTSEKGDALLVFYQAEGLFLNTMRLEPAEHHLDRLVTTDDMVAVSQTPGFVTWTMPFENDSWADAISTYTVFNEDGEELIVTWISSTEFRWFSGPTTEDLSGMMIYVGYRYGSVYTPSTVFIRDQNGAARKKGRLMLWLMRFFFEDSSDVEVEVEVAGKPTRTKTLDQDAATGSIEIPVRGKNSDSTVTLSTSELGPFNLSAIEWEGESFPSGSNN